MATKLLMNVLNALDNLPTPKEYGWLDSTVALHWIKGNGPHKQCVANRVAKIHLHKRMEWRYVLTDENPAELESRGGPVQTSALRNVGLQWLQCKSRWPDNPVTQSSPASEGRAKVRREVLNLAQTKLELDEFDQLLERATLRRTLRVSAWLETFNQNWKHEDNKLGPLLTDEIEEVRAKKRQKTTLLKKLVLSLTCNPMRKE